MKKAILKSSLYDSTKQYERSTQRAMLSKQADCNDKRCAREETPVLQQLNLPGPKGIQMLLNSSRGGQAEKQLVKTRSMTPQYVEATEKSSEHFRPHNSLYSQTQNYHQYGQESMFCSGVDPLDSVTDLSDFSLVTSHRTATTVMSTFSQAKLHEVDQRAHSPTAGPRAQAQRIPQRSPPLLLNSATARWESACERSSQPAVCDPIPIPEIPQKLPENLPARAYVAEPAMRRSFKIDRFSPSNGVYVRLSPYERYVENQVSNQTGFKDEFIQEKELSSSQVTFSGQGRAGSNSNNKELLHSLQNSVHGRLAAFTSSLTAKSDQNANNNAFESCNDFEELMNDNVPEAPDVIAKPTEVVEQTQKSLNLHEQSSAVLSAKQPINEVVILQNCSPPARERKSAKSSPIPEPEAKQQKEQQNIQALLAAKLKEKTRSYAKNQTKAQTDSEDDRFIIRQISTPLGEHKILAKTTKATGVTVYQHAPRISMKTLTEELGVK